MRNSLTSLDVVELFREQGQWCRENGESDMRYIVHMAHGIKKEIEKGTDREEVIASYSRELESD